MTWTKPAILAFLAGLSLLGGCYHYVPFQVTVRDATTHQPVPGATIDAYYPSAGEFGPRESTVTTDRNGQATVPVPTQGPSQVCLYFRSLFLDDPMPTGVLNVPLEPYRRAMQQEERAKATPTSAPSPVVVDVLSPEEHHKKYPHPETQP